MKVQESSNLLLLVGSSESPHFRARVAELSKQSSFRISVADTRVSGEWADCPVEYHLTAAPALLSSTKVRGVWRVMRLFVLFRSISADVVFVMYAGYDILLPLILSGRRYVLSTWGSDILRLRGVIHKWILRWGLRKACRVFAVSDQMISKIRSLTRDRLRSPVIKQIYGIDLKNYEFRPGSEASHDEVERVLSPRWALPVYNLRTVVLAMKKVMAVRPSVHFLVRNTDWMESQQSQAHFDEVTHPLIEDNLWERVAQLGIVKHEHFLSLMGHCQVIVSLAHSDGAPVTVLEAMAMGKIVICGRIPATEALISSGENGYLVDKDNPDELASIILYVFDNLDRIGPVVGKNARDTVLRIASLGKETDLYRKELLICATIKRPSLNGKPGTRL